MAGDRHIWTLLLMVTVHSGSNTHPQVKLCKVLALRMLTVGCLPHPVRYMSLWWLQEALKAKDAEIHRCSVRALQAARDCKAAQQACAESTRLLQVGPGSPQAAFLVAAASGHQMDAAS